MRLYLAEFETRRFHFRAYGKTRASARDALVNGLTIHATQYNIAPDWWFEFEEGIIITPIRLGCYRDGELLNIKQSA